MYRLGLFAYCACQALCSLHLSLILLTEVMSDLTLADFTICTQSSWLAFILAEVLCRLSDTAT